MKSEHIYFDNVINEAFALYQYNEGGSVVALFINNSMSNEFISDAGRLLLIFSNIISNAIKYLNQNEPISFLKVDISGYDNQVIIILEDNGNGIDE